ncbi:MAG: DUF5676 family membrane protein [Candidatus Uhrbacteria bacterium]
MCNAGCSLNAPAAGKSCAVVGGVAFLVCAIAYAVAPGAIIALFNLLFHGIDLAKIVKPFAFGEMIIGLVIFVILSYVLTWAWVALYNRLLGRSPADGKKDNCCGQ